VTETGRLETFADGVFAIAITLLVLAIRLPTPDEDLGPALAHQWPEFVAYLVSFLTVGIMWVQHHRLFTLIRRSNSTFAMINVIILMFIAFVPFPTAVLAQRLGNRVDAVGATVFYGATMIAIAAMFNAIWRYGSARGGHLLVAEISASRRAEARGYRYGVPIYGLITLLAFLNPYLSLAGFGRSPLLGAPDQRSDHRRLTGAAKRKRPRFRGRSISSVRSGHGTVIRFCGPGATGA
jgi:uncharacterized membrane protein